MNTKDPAIEKTELVIKALDYAHKNILDINNVADVKKILEAIDSTHSSEKDAEKFMKLLQASQALLVKDVDRRRKIN